MAQTFVYAAGADLTKRVTFVRLENGEVDTTIRDDRRQGGAGTFVATVGCSEYE